MGNKGLEGMDNQHKVKQLLVKTARLQKWTIEGMDYHLFRLTCSQKVIHITKDQELC